VGASLGPDPDTFRTVGAVILAIFGLILPVPVEAWILDRTPDWLTAVSTKY